MSKYPIVIKRGLGRTLDRRTVLQLGMAGVVSASMASWPTYAAGLGKIKQVTFLKRKRGMSREAFIDYWLKVHTPLAVGAPGLAGYSQTLVDADDQSGFDGVAERYFATEADRTAFAASSHAAKLRADAANFIQLDPLPLDLVADEVTLVPQSTDAWFRGKNGGAMPAIKSMLLLTRREGVSREAFLRHWHVVNAQLAPPCPGLARYTQLTVRASPGVALDGIIEMYFENAETKYLFDSSWDKVTLDVDSAIVMDQSDPILGRELMAMPANWQPVWSKV